MNWMNGLQNVGTALTSIGAIGLVITLAYCYIADLDRRTVNKNHVTITVAALLAALLAGAFMTGAWA